MTTIDTTLELVTEDVTTARLMAPCAVQCDTASWAAYTTATPSTEWVDSIASEGLCACCGESESEHSPAELASCRAAL